MPRDPGERHEERPTDILHENADSRTDRAK